MRTHGTSTVMHSARRALTRPTTTLLTSSPSSPLPHRLFSSLPAVHTFPNTPDASALLSPAVMFLVRSHHLDPSSIRGTGRAGRLLKADVLTAISKGTAKQLPDDHSDSHPSAPTPGKDLHPSQSTPAPTAPKQAGPRVTESGRRNRSALFTPTPPAPPATKMQAIDVPSRAATPTPPPPPAPKPSPSPLPPFRGRARTHEDIPLTNIRKVIATRLLQSKQSIPHSYVSQSIDMTAALAFRAALKAQGYTPVPSLNDLVIRASALSLRRHPAVNATLPKGASTHTPSPTIDISVAVATPTGLLTPILPSTDRLRLSAITSSIKDLAGRAKVGKLKPEEFQGGSFTISNLGMFGVSSFSAIINPPQACILAVGGSTEVVRKGAGGVGGGGGVGGLGGGGGSDGGQVAPVYVPVPAAASPSYAAPVVVKTGAEGVGAAAAVADVGAGPSVGADLSSSPMLGVTLVFDERAIDAEQGGNFLATLKTLLEAPEAML